MLTKGERIVRLLLPMAARDWYERHWIKLTFVGREREFFLGEFDIDLPSFHHNCSVVNDRQPSYCTGIAGGDRDCAAPTL